jgi:hypothetical protein
MQNLKQVKSSLQLFGTGMLQVFFVAINTVFLSKSVYLGVGIAAFMISMIWSYNVKKVVFGTIADRVAYAAGASAGSLLGLLTSEYLSRFIQNIWA